MAFSNSSVLVYDNANNTVVDFQTNQSTPLTVNAPGSFNGVTLNYVVSRPGFSCLEGSFVAGGSIDITATLV